MTSPSDRVDPTVPIGSAMVDTLKAAGLRWASALARRLTLRTADVLVAPASRTPTQKREGSG